MRIIFPFFRSHSIFSAVDELGFVQWPLYDRIYVGAAVQSANQFLAILRLLKIGGVMIAPVRDKVSVSVFPSFDNVPPPRSMRDTWSREDSGLSN